ncbi:Uncharacterized protein PECH_000614 [Penicillium ucsense]|uniref:Up-regulated during septation protein 1 domain-containing protein n=1 Tax=Penicillium ucsense TaxID=2839758 RepID=A0A8J8VXY6_9EURO|nr:Uncharacterized protein PECM_000670 [Penicillium ucsense]KAF7738349.1 Uncharacterized protein PECH_000614 [Penicillium ucsense]
MTISLRSSQSSYGDPRYMSTATVPFFHGPPAQSVVDGYRDEVHHQDGQAHSEPLDATQSSKSGQPNLSDPVTMYLLTETAIEDSNRYEILPFEEVEHLKKERSILKPRIDSIKRKLALETKLRDAAQALGKLDRPPSPRSSSEYGGHAPPGVVSLEKSDSELAVSQRRCDELAQELRNLEGRSSEISRRLLEHTAGVLQITHKGLKKARTDEQTHERPEDDLEFDDRSLYRTPEHLDHFGTHGRIEDSAPSAIIDSQSQRRLEDLSDRLCQLLAQAKPDEFVEPPPHPGAPSSSIETHLAYLENGMESLRSYGSTRAVPPDTKGSSAETDDVSKAQLVEINSRVQGIVDRFGLTRSPALPPPPELSDSEGLQEQLSYLQAGVDALASRVDGLLEQKSILTTQIQQQRELNNKSDAERDAHIADLTEQLAQMRRNFEASEQESRTYQDQVEATTQQMEALRNDGSSTDKLKASLVQAEGEISRLQGVVDSLHSEADLRAEEVREIHDRTEEAKEAHERATQEIAHLEAEIQQLRTESTARLEDAHGQREQMDAQLKTACDQRDEFEAQLKQLVDQRDRDDAQLNDLVDQRDQADAQLKQVTAEREQVESQMKEALAQRDQAEERSAQMQREMTELEGEVVRITTELTMVKAELDGAYGTRAQRAAEVAANPEIQMELDHLRTRNIELTEELAVLKGQKGSGNLQQRADTLERELRETLDDYEAMTKASIEFEKEREQFERLLDTMRDRCEQLEQQLSEERINWMNLNSPGSVGREGSETTSLMVLKNEFKKMMRDTRNENMKNLKREQEERRRLEGLLRALRKEHAQVTGKPFASPVGTPS